MGKRRGHEEDESLNIDLCGGAGGVVTQHVSISFHCASYGARAEKLKTTFPRNPFGLSGGWGLAALSFFFLMNEFFKLKDNCFTEFCCFFVKHQHESAICSYLKGKVISPADWDD